MRSSVLFPQPDGPTTVTNSPGRTSNVVSRSACVPSGKIIDNPVETQCRSSPDVAHRHNRSRTGSRRRIFPSCSMHHHPAGHIHRLAGAVRGLVGGQEQRHVGDVGRLGEPAER